TALGLLNSRIKDYYDLALLSRTFSFEGQLLVTAIRATFRHRGTAIEPDTVGLSDAFSSDPARSAQWRAFLRRSRFSEEAGGLPELVSETHGFATEVLAAAVTGEPFKKYWSPGGPWEP
ncbi:MAG: nucleotidyl transferase AbiEii/AbiGii toxin family protein, partial [Acetobacteraceae bacterium]|nr:nucleotidyl transferase AbiEii/AbiGii toxin family protein [Acetobacteraceae bacterium]